MMLIYLDNNATTQAAPEVVESLLPYFSARWGNPSSLHRFGAEVRSAVDRARAQVAELVGASRPTEIVFTSGGTESNHLAIRGWLAAVPQKKHVVTSAVEHPSVLSIFHTLEKEGYQVTYLPVNAEGALSLEELEQHLHPETALLSLMWGNNETGVLFPLESISKICEKKGVCLHTDATQAVGKIPIKVGTLPIHLLSLSGHKFHGPKGIGALYVRKGTSLHPLLTGGSQERGFRAGTENVPGIVGLGQAAGLAKEALLSGQMRKVEALRNHLENRILETLPSAKRVGGSQNRLPNTSSFRLTGLDGESLCLLLSEANFAVSTGSACSSGKLEPSHVLSAMGFKNMDAREALRISLSRYTTEKEVEKFLQVLPPLVHRLEKQKIRHSP